MNVETVAQLVLFLESSYARPQINASNHSYLYMTFHIRVLIANFMRVLSVKNLIVKLV
jgi:hypothetical protein